MRIFRIALSCLLALSFAHTLIAQNQSQGPPPGPPSGLIYQAKQTQAGRMEIIGGIPLLHVWGTPKEMGEAVGKLALSQAPGILEYPRALARLYGVEFIFPVFLKLGEGMVDHFPKAYQEELRAIQKASNAPWETLVAGNTMFDLKKFVLCSGMALEPGRSFAQGTVLARNLDYPAVAEVHRYSLVTVYQPLGKHGFVSVGFPGLVGVLSGMNDAGLALAIHEVIDVKKGQKRFDPSGIPYAITYRMVLEECTTIDEAISLLKRCKRTCTTNLLIADRTQVAVLEISPEQVLRRSAKNGFTCCTNHFCLAEHKPEKPSYPFKSLERLLYLESCESPRPFSVEQIRLSLNAVCLERKTLQTMLFDTEALALWVSFSGPPSSAGPLVRLELAKALKR